MAKQFDAALKHLLDTYPADWLAFLQQALGLPGGKAVDVIEADLSTVTTAADKVLRVRAAEPWLLHLELQAGPDARLERRLLRYNVLLNGRYNLPVRTVLVLLSRKADRPALTGVLRQEWPAGRCYLEFRYDVVRLWRQPVGSLLAGGLGTLPLAPLGDVDEEELPAVIERIHRRMQHEASPAEVADLWTATYVLLGVNFPSPFAAQLLRRVLTMKESSTYQAIIEEGKAQALQETLLELGSKRLDVPDESTRAVVQSTLDLNRLKQWIERLPDAASWADLLAQARVPRRSRRRK